jgi:RNA polymerase sigma-70 factor (ECF subfamily)
MTLAPDEAGLRLACERGEYDAAATLFLELYGRELLAFMVDRLGVSEGADAFSDFAEAFWKALPGFEWRTSMRGWAYTIARHTIYRQRRAVRSWRRRQEPTGESPFFEQVARLRSATREYLRTDVKERIRELRRRLPEDDQILLILRIDRQLSWAELAAVLSGAGETLAPAELTRWSARLRQRFAAATARLKRLAREDGLLDRSD